MLDWAAWAAAQVARGPAAATVADPSPAIPVLVAPGLAAATVADLSPAIPVLVASVARTAGGLSLDTPALAEVTEQDLSRFTPQRLRPRLGQWGGSCPLVCRDRSVGV